MNVGAVAGGVVGGIIFLLLIVLLFIFRKRLLKDLKHMRSRRVAPSAEFMNTSPKFFSIHSRVSGLDTSHKSYLSHRRGASTFTIHNLHDKKDVLHVDVEQPSLLRLGSFPEQVVEKVDSTTKQRELYLRASSPQPDDYLPSYLDVRSVYMYDPPLGESQVSSFVEHPPASPSVPPTSPLTSSDHSNSSAAHSYADLRPGSPDSAEEDIGMAR